ncbi:MAG: ribonuclease HI [Cytophagales bacterium]|nr:ribonuclease HI [Cytophagales bacterium]
MNTIYIYTDGACSGNPGPGGYGVLMRYGGNEKTMSDGYRYTTNNRMELMAVIKALQALKRTDLPILIQSDSEYVINSITKRWVYEWDKKNYKDKKNADLWRKYLEVSKNYKISYKWIKGHAGHKENEMCDALAVKAAQKPDLQIDEGYEQEVR